MRHYSLTGYGVSLGNNQKLMKDLIDRIIALESISKELEPTEKERDRLNQEVQAYANTFIKALKTRLLGCLILYYI